MITSERIRLIDRDYAVAKTSIEWAYYYRRLREERGGNRISVSPSDVLHRTIAAEHITEGGRIAWILAPESAEVHQAFFQADPPGPGSYRRMYPSVEQFTGWILSLGFAPARPIQRGESYAAVVPHA